MGYQCAFIDAAAPAPGLNRSLDEVLVKFSDLGRLRVVVDGSIGEVEFCE